jgi:hypothetical protein
VVARSEGRTVERHGGRKVLLGAVLGLVLTGAAACGSNDQDTGAVNATPTTAASETASATPSPEPSATPSEDTAQVAGPIVVDVPAAGATVQRKFSVTGTSRTAEGTVLWQLLRGDTEVANGFAQGGSSSAAAFRFTVEAPAAGTYTVRVFEESAKDGAAANAVERTVTVR